MRIFWRAISYFTFVKNRFPFSRYATLAELRIADAFFAQDKFADAADAYKLFIRFHPNHPEVTDGYAAYRVCKVLRRTDTQRMDSFATIIRKGSDRHSRRNARNHRFSPRLS